MAAQLQAQQSALEAESRQLAHEKTDLEQKRAQANQQEQKLSELSKQLSTIDASLQAGQDHEEELRISRERAQVLEGENGALKNKMDELVQRKQKLEDARGAICPMCGQDLSSQHRQELLDEFNSSGKGLGDQFRLNRSEMAELRQKIDSLQSAQRQMQELEKQRFMLQKEEALIQQELTQQAQREEAWKSTKADRLVQIQEELQTSNFLPQVRQRQSELDSQISALAYDQKFHGQLRQQAQENAASEQAWQELQIARSGFDLLQAELETTEEDLRHDLNLSQELKEKVALETDSLTEAKAQLQDSRQAERELIDLREELDVFNRRMGEIDQALAVIQTQRERQKSLRSRMQELNEEIRQYNKLETAFGKDGVPAMLIEQALPELEEQANHLLHRLSDYTMGVRFNTQRAYKDSKRKDLMETLDILISDGSGTRDYETYSGGEAFRINFAIRLALSRILARRAGARLQTLVIDEGFGNQDAQGRQRLIEAINIVKPDFEKILIITHIDELKDYFSNRIEVTKTPTGSKAEVILA